MKDILERSRTIKAEYEKQIQDLTVMQEGECKIPGAESKMTVKTVSKGRKFRMENITRQEGPEAESTLVSVVTSNDGEKRIYKHSTGREPESHPQGSQSVAPRGVLVVSFHQGRHGERSG